MNAKVAIKQSVTEEWFNAVSHGVAALTAVGGFVILIVFGLQSEAQWSLFSAFFYGISLILLYTASTLYHAVQKIKWKHVFNIFDHSGIFLLIAGTYTPVLLITIGGNLGWTLFGVQWGLAIIGIILKIFFTGRYEIASLMMYAFMGWFILFKIGFLYAALPTIGFWLLVGGGLAYTIGIIFYVLDKRLFLSHFIWHLFVVAGSVMHFLLVLLFVF